MSDLLLHIDDGIACLTINRPERLNALTAEMLDTLQLRCREIERTPDVHVVILRGEGRAFCAGGDINAWASHAPEQFARHWIRDGHLALDCLARLRQPVIAVLDGDVFGGGLELAACADYRIAEAHIRIGQPEPALGIIPGWSGTQRAVRRFGAQPVRRMALFGDVFSAQDAAAMGLVDKVAETGAGLDTARTLARTLRHRGPVATELAKMLINAAEGEERERVLEALAGQIAAAHPHLNHGLASFRAREKPDYWSNSNKET